MPEETEPEVPAANRSGWMLSASGSFDGCSCLLSSFYLRYDTALSGVR